MVFRKTLLYNDFILKLLFLLFLNSLSDTSTNVGNINENEINQ